MTDITAHQMMHVAKKAISDKVEEEAFKHKKFIESCLRSIKTAARNGQYDTVIDCPTTEKQTVLENFLRERGFSLKILSSGCEIMVSWF